MPITPGDVAAAADEQRRDLARDDLIAFASYVDPLAAHWYKAAHLRKIAGVLERVERGELRRVIINIAPRHWKSSLASEKFPAWWLGKHPESAVIVASHAVSLAEKFSKSVREIVGGDRYKALFPDVRIKRDSNSADDWLLETGYRTSFRAVGTGGGISGHGAQLILPDDVNDPNKAESDAETKEAWRWYREVIRTRLEPNGAIVIINNRVGANDLTAYLLDRERNDSADAPSDWTQIVIPAQNPDGSYLWEDRFPREEYEKLQRDARLWRIQYMQEVTPREGMEIKREWFEFVARLPEGVEEQCRTIDTAWTEKKADSRNPDYFASIGSAMSGGWLYLVDPYEARMQMPDAVNWIQDAKKLKPKVRFGMAKAAGETIAKQFLERLGVPTEDLEAERVDLRTRLVPFVSFASRGLVKLVGDPARWERFLTQATAFPDNQQTHDDLLACCAGLTQMHGLRVAAPRPKVRPVRAWYDETAFTMH